MNIIRKLALSLLTITMLLVVSSLISGVWAQTDGPSMSQITPLTEALSISSSLEYTDPPLSEAAEIALGYIAEQEGLPATELQVVGEETLVFPNLERTYILVTIIHDQPEAFRSFSVLVDPDTGEVEPDVNQIRADDEAAYQAKYGKLDPGLYEHLQTAADGQLIPIAIWATATDTVRTPEEIAAELATIYPQGQEALETVGVVWAVEDPELRLEIKQRYNQLLAEETARQVQPIAEWLENREYEVQRLSGIPSLAATVTKQDVLALAELEVVGQIFLVGYEEEPASDIAVPTSRMPVVWNRGITGNGVRLAIVEQGRINNTVRNCLNVMATRPGTWSDNDHKSRVAAVAACNNATLRGAAYGSQILDAAHSGPEVSAAEALLWAVDTGLADVVNHSGVFESDTNLQYLDKIYDYMVRTYIFTAAIAAGNTSGNVRTPAKGWNVIAVGNVDDQNSAAWADDLMRSSSAYINPSTGVEKPEVAAPGTLINTVLGCPNQHTDCTGTSFAAPQVAGLAALLMQRNATLKNWPSAVKAIIMASAVHNIEGARRLSDRDGAGSINAALADEVAQVHGSGSCNGPCWWNINTTSGSPAVNQSLYRYFHVAQGERVRVVISWLSVASVDGINDSLRTNYDLYVRQPNGSVVQSSVSANNSFEIVEFVAPATGPYEIQVYRNPAGDYNESSNFLGIAWTKQATYLPDLRRDSNWIGEIIIRNDGTEPRPVRITYLWPGGSQADVHNTVNDLLPNAVWVRSLPAGFNGHAVVDGSEDLSAAVLLRLSSPYYAIDTYTGIATPAAAAHVPVVHRNNNTWYSQIFIQNTSGVQANVTIQFIASTAGISCTPPAINIDAGGRYVIDTTGYDRIRGL